MRPQKNDLVKIFFKNGLQVEGIVSSWGKDEIEIASDGSKNKLIITKPKEIFMIKIMADVHDTFAMPTENPSKLDTNPNFEIPADSVESGPQDDNNYPLPESYDNYTEEQLRLKSLAELKIMENNIEREAIAQKLRSHHIGEVKGVQYVKHDEIPGFYKK